MLSRIGAACFAAVAISGLATAQPMVLTPAPLSGSQAVPPNGSAATGVVNLTLDLATSTLSWHVAYNGVVATAMHFHGPALPGSNAGIQVPLGTANPEVGSTVLTAQQISDLQSGLWYLNVHSAAFPAGEIRGQIDAATGISVVLNEVMYDGVGADGGQTFVELHGPAGTDLTGWRVVGVEAGSATSCGQVNTGHDITVTGAIAADGFYVLADDDGSGATLVTVPATHNGGVVDQLVGNIDLENGTDAVQLFHPTGLLLDAVTYGDNACGTIDVLGNAIVEGVNAFDVFGGYSLSRWPAGNDTNNNKLDFTPQCSPSAGAAGIEPRAFFFDGNTTISGAAGGSVDMTMHTGRTNMGQYIVFAFLTNPTSKSTLMLPFDPVTNIFITLATSGTPLVANFVGNFDACGESTATLTIPASTPITSSLDLFFVGATIPINGGSIATNAVQVTLNP